MDGENSGKPYEQMDDLGVPLFLETPICEYVFIFIYIYISGHPHDLPRSILYGNYHCSVQI